MYDMYESFYHLHAQPFHLTPDPGFLFYSSKHQRTLDYLLYGIYEGEGLIVVTGDVGTGKTTLVYKLLERLAEQENIIAAHLVATQRKAEYLLPMVATALGLAQESSSNVMLLPRLESFLTNQAQEGKRVLLIVDEAQNLSTPALEVLRLLTNYQFNYKTLLQIFLIGQPEFRNTLHTGPLKPLRQRMIASCHLGPLAVEETRDYIEHRLSVAGWNGDPRFTPETYAAIHHYTDGVPRRINMLCHRLLVLGCQEETHEINEGLINRIIQEWREELLSNDEKNGRRPNKVRISNQQQPSESRQTRDTAAGNVQPLNLNAQKDYRAPSVARAQTRPEAITASVATLAPPRSESKSADSHTEKPSLKQQLSTADTPFQRYAFFKRQGLLLALLLLIPTSVGVYQFIRDNSAWKDPEPTLIEPMAPASRSSMTPAVVKASETPAAEVVQPAPIQPQQPISGPAVERSLVPEQVGLEPTARRSLTRATQSTAAISVTDYMLKGDRLMELGDLASARLFYLAAAESDYAPAMTAVGKTYDPQIINQRRLRGINADPSKALQWYRQAVQAGDLKAEEYLRELTPVNQGISDIQ